jgi:very-short-patch-repair endonuclease
MIEMTPAKLEEIKYNDYIIRKFSHEDGFEAYYLEDIGKLLNIKAIRNSVKNFSGDEIISSEQRRKYSALTYKLHKCNLVIDNNKKLLTKQGLTKFLSRSRSPAACDLAKFFNINVYEHRFAPVETTTIKLIQETFAGEVMVTQYQVNNYRIDLYFPNHKLAIECDERDHADRNPNYEIDRENEIKKETNCTFIRYNPNAVDFSIGNVLNQIYRKLKESNN